MKIKNNATVEGTVTATGATLSGLAANKFVTTSTNGLLVATDAADLPIGKMAAAGVTGTAPIIASLGSLEGSVTSCDAYLYANATNTGLITKYTIPATNFFVTDNVVNYLYISYNGGNPAYFCTTDVSLINESNTIPVETILVSDGYFHTANWDALGDGLPNKLHKMLVKTRRYAWESGLALTNATGVVTIASGRVWMGAVPFDLDAVHSDGTGSSTWFFYYHSGGSWVHNTTTTSFNNTQYDNGTNLVTLSNNKFNITWIFRGVEDQNHGYYIVSDKQYASAADAIAETKVPAVPLAISQHAILIGRIICEKNLAPSTVESALGDIFHGSVINDHNNLGNLQGGTAAEYYHLTAAQHTGLTAIPDERIPVSDGLGSFTSSEFLTYDANDVLHSPSAKLQQILIPRMDSAAAPTLSAEAGPLTGTYLYACMWYTRYGPGEPFYGTTEITLTDQQTLITQPLNSNGTAVIPEVTHWKIFRNKANTGAQAEFFDISGLLPIATTSYTDSALDVSLTVSANTTLSGGQFEIHNSFVQAASFGLFNLGLGFHALKSTTTGGWNTAVGQNSGAVVTTGTSNTFVGWGSGLQVTTGGYNTVVGAYSSPEAGVVGSILIGTDLTTGISHRAIFGPNTITSTILRANVGIGTEDPLWSLDVAGVINTSIGLYIDGLPFAIASGTEGHNTAVGTVALDSGDNTGDFITALGYQSLYYNTSGNDNTAAGAQSLVYNTTGSLNSAFGTQALFSNTSGNTNTAVGYQASYSTKEGIDNSSLGMQALYSATTGSVNTAIGVQALYSTTTGHHNIGLGTKSLFNNTSGSYNTVVGENTGLGITTGSSNTILGSRVTGLATTLSNHVIISDGDGNRRMITDNWGDTAIGMGMSPNGYDLAVWGAGYAPQFAVQSTTNGTSCSIYADPDGTHASIEVQVCVADVCVPATLLLNPGDPGVAGKVGINILSPQYSLDVGGDINVGAARAYRYEGYPVITAIPANSSYFFAGAGNLTTTGGSNYGIGPGSLAALTTGEWNVSIGSGNQSQVTTGSYNISLGLEALARNQTGAANIAIGTYSLIELGQEQTAGDFVVGASYTITFVGTTDFTLIGAAENTIGTSFTASDVGTGDGRARPAAAGGNTVIGHSSGRGIITGSNNTIIGATVQGLPANLSNNIIIADGSGNRRITSNDQGVITLPQGKLVLSGTTSGSVTIQSAAVAGSTTLTLPTVVASAGQMLTDVAGDGVLSWTSPSIAALTVPVTPVTTTVNLTAAESFSLITNEGASAGTTITLPSAAAGLTYTMYVQTAQVVTVTANTDDTIRILLSTTAAAGSITSSTVGSLITLTAINNVEWIATTVVGNWSI